MVLGKQEKTFFFVGYFFSSTDKLRSEEERERVNTAADKCLMMDFFDEGTWEK